MRAAGIVVYQPDINRLERVIDRIYEQVDILVIYCNSNFTWEKNDKIVLLGNTGENVGIAKALNCILDYAKNEGAKWCLLLDQDSVVPKSIIDNYSQYTYIENAAILTLKIGDELGSVSCCNNTIDKVLLCITSGSYINIEIWEKVGKFRNDFFIDYVDWEYCARISNHDYYVYRLNEMVLDHRLGNETKHKVGKIELCTYNHNASRKYYITRNSFIISKLYPYIKEFKHPFLRTIKRMLKVILVEDDKIAKLTSMVRGILDSRKFEMKE